MIKSNLEKNIISNNISSFRYHIKKSPISMIIKIIPFLCACGSLLMLQLVDTKVNIETIYNKENCMRMGLLSENYDIVNYLYPKNCMDKSKILRYYVCSGGRNMDIYSLLDKDIHWNYITENDIIQGIKNGNIETIEYLISKVKIPLSNYSYLCIQNQRLLLKDNDLFNYYIENNINLNLILNELHTRKIHNMKFLKSIITLKQFLLEYEIK